MGRGWGVEAGALAGPARFRELPARLQVEQLVGPVHAGLQRPMTPMCRPTPADEQTEALVQMRSDLLDGQGAYARRRQLEREGNAVQPLTDLHHGGCGAIGEREVRRSVANPGVVCFTHKFSYKNSGIGRR